MTEEPIGRSGYQDGTAPKEKIIPRESTGRLPVSTYPMDMLIGYKSMIPPGGWSVSPSTIIQNT